MHAEFYCDSIEQPVDIACYSILEHSQFPSLASVFGGRLADSNREFTGGTNGEVTTSSDPPLRKCQEDCLEACAKGARKIEMACGTGKTRVMKELAANVSGRVSCLVMENLP